MADTPSPAYTDTEGAASYLALSPATLETWRSRGGGPPFTKMGSNVRYAYTDLAAWAEANRQEPKEPSVD